MPSGFRWDPASARYRDAQTGRYVAPPQVRTAVDAVIAGSADRLRRLAGRVATGTLAPAAWATAAAGELKALHLAQAAAGGGGWASLTPADFGAVGATLRTQYRYLAGFAADVAAGRLSGPAIAARAALYAEAARATYEAAAGRAAGRAGAGQQRNVLHAAESCPGCRAETARGWMPLGAGVPIGQRPCKANCRCAWEYRAGP